MGEISGFGGGYEECCRAMVLAGIRWIDEHPGAEPAYHGYRDVYGVVLEDNEDAQGLTQAIIDAARGRGGATGAMHHACVAHCMHYLRVGWERYCGDLRERADR